MTLMLNNPYVDVDAYLAHGGELTNLIIPTKERRFWGAGAETALSTMSADEQPSALTRFARLSAFCQALGERDGELRIGDILSEEEARAVWREAAATAAKTSP
jgi:hypothetical protein